MDLNKNKKSITAIILVSAYILIIAGSKLLPHPENFTPLLGLAIFGGAMFLKKRMFLIITIAALFISDFIFNNFVHPEYISNKSGLIFFADYMIWVYLSILLVIFGASFALKKFSYLRLLITSIGGALVFYLITNFGAWLSSPELYTRDLSGLLQSYRAGIPFFRGTIISNIVYSFVIFGLYDIIARYIFRKHHFLSF